MRLIVGGAVVAALLVVIAVTFFTWPTERLAPDEQQVVPVYGDSFDGSTLDLSKWSLYEGPATNDRGTWAASQVQVVDGKLELTANGSKMGGLCLCGPAVNDLIYADVSMTLSIEKGRNVYLAALMWPLELSGGRTPWPTQGEIDIIETHAADRQTAYWNIWWGNEPDNGFQLLGDEDKMRTEYPQFTNGTKADFTQPQEVRLEWRPTYVSIFHAGNLVFHTEDPEIMKVLSHPMHLALQLDMPEGTASRTGKVVARIDDVVVRPIPGVSRFTRDGSVVSG